MSSCALILGSMGVLAETPDLERRAFNTAFEEHELFWHWDETAYRRLMEVPGCRARIRYYAMAQGVDVDVEAICAAKIAALGNVAEKGITPRPGIVDIINSAKDNGLRIGLATTAKTELIDLVLYGLRASFGRDDFDFLGDRAHVAHVKPASDIFVKAVQDLDVRPQNCVVIEDSPENCEAAVMAGLTTYAYPGIMSRGRRFPQGVSVVDQPDATHLPVGDCAA